ncbi:MAG: hypothetical protein OWT28_09480 [Firmicutes bacterium]|nr:hypothetical protein [Bacillota bacterium]
MMALDETIRVEDEAQDVDGLKLVYAKEMARYMEGVTVDYVKSWFGKRLVIHSALAGNC